jgi:hypothetical protein
MLRSAISALRLIPGLILVAGAAWIGTLLIR